jgi:phage-related protein
VRFTVEYFHPRVLAAIDAWPVDVLADYAHLIELLEEHEPNLRMPHSRAFGSGLFELRARGREGIGRAFYCFLVGRRVVIVHEFIKKTGKTPDRELKIARKRMKEITNA